MAVYNVFFENTIEEHGGVLMRGRSRGGNIGSIRPQESDDIISIIKGQVMAGCGVEPQEWCRTTGMCRTTGRPRRIFFE